MDSYTLDLLVTTVNSKGAVHRPRALNWYVCPVHEISDIYLIGFVWVYGSRKSMDATHSPVCREVWIISGLRILNLFALRNLLRLFRSSIGLHLLFGFWDQKK